MRKKIFYSCIRDLCLYQKLIFVKYSYFLVLFHVFCNILFSFCMAQEFMLGVVLKVWLDLFKLFSKDHIMDSAK